MLDPCYLMGHRVGKGNATSSCGQTPLEPLADSAMAGPRMPEESHTDPTDQVRGQPHCERRTGHLDRASPDPFLGSMEQVAT